MVIAMPSVPAKITSSTCAIVSSREMPARSSLPWYVDVCATPAFSPEMLLSTTRAANSLTTAVLAAMDPAPFSNLPAQWSTCLRSHPGT
ncbi:hypothetical protein I7I53_09998 [Histoplasma capsulatum var. duboisii H88]|uniref:Uncharacterized protein n=1 Tax=Ajellomyces capsulatus (strain H88) TaxID=544711 RepID=A0A8A1LCV7_AJEC8|nr:hypothetical protein I7I53_09998 [Histoplasma capsulatum var. duboisii H88]